MDLVLTELVGRCAAGEPVALCTVVTARGSTPQGAGARMLLLPDGHTVGTLGGGCVEAEVRQQALRVLAAGESKLLSFKLDHDYGWDDGLICGGTMEIFVQTLQSPAAAEPYAQVLRAVETGQSAEIRFEYESTGQTQTYAETVDPPARLIIAGAGHVGQALAPLASAAGFRVSVIDDRADCASAERFPSIQTRIVGDIETELAGIGIDAQTYIVIVTRGHRHDGKALGVVIDSPAKYIGLIGSRRKVLTIFQDLASRGVALEKLSRVRAPIGLEIGAVTVAEIAISIAAELVAVRRGRGERSARPLKLDDELLGKIRDDGATAQRAAASSPSEIPH
jgi:xanthine dehydrogenase accessory factor